MTDQPVTRADLQVLNADLKTSMAELKAEFRSDMVTQIRWLAGLFIVQFIATVGATTTLVNFVVSRAHP